MKCNLFFSVNWACVNSSRICSVEARFFVLKHVIHDCIVFLSCLIFLIILFCMFFTHNFCNIFLMKARALHKIQKKKYYLKKNMLKKKQMLITNKLIFNNCSRRVYKQILITGNQIFRILWERVSKNLY